MRFSESELLGIISEIGFVRSLSGLSFSEDLVRFEIVFDFESLDQPILFEVYISPSYPLKLFDSESISFKNIELINFQHVMSDGSVCFHNSHCIIFKEKLIQDFSAIKSWIIKYVICGEQDDHYEHLIKFDGSYDGALYSYQFADTKEGFEKNEFGTVSLEYLSTSPYNDKVINNYFVQNFINNSVIKVCRWSAHYLNRVSKLSGYYLFIENAPAVNGRFSFDNWSQFKDVLTQDFLSNLWKHIFEIRTSFNKINPLPIFLGFYTQNKEVHWQVALVNIDNLFFDFKKKSIDSDGSYILKDEKISWALAENSSYKYFFGRGAFDEKITESKILIIGIGAVGSNVARTLVKVGCKYITLVDYDIKKPENICRSEYEFPHAYINKVDELSSVLLRISPFVDIKMKKDFFTEHIKYIDSFNEQDKNSIQADLSNYDYIFDCSTDDDLMYILNNLEILPTILNLSINNHAKALVCGISPNLYRFVRHQFNLILKDNAQDLYNPTGCWNPTFKASYNDIAILVQFALKHINIMVKGNSLENFVVKYIDEEQVLQVETY